jgi:hypothetical protein
MVAISISANSVNKPLPSYTIDLCVKCKVCQVSSLFEPRIMIGEEEELGYGKGNAWSDLTL